MIEGYVSNKMVYTIWSFLEFCYIAWHNIITEKTLGNLKDVLAYFCKYQTVF
jgi:hypothetical protein